MNFGYRWRIMCLLHGLVEGIYPCKLDQINAHPKGRWYQMAQKKTDQQIIHGLEC
jgi:hypothetical protein